MLKQIQEWFGMSPQGQSLGLGHGPKDSKGHGHTHGSIDPTIATTTKGIWAIKWSFVVLAITSVLQLVVVVISGSVALLADTIHNVGDAVTAIPLWIAFVLARRKPSKTFTYGLGRVEDLAGVAIVAIILFSAVFAGYEAVDRLIHPQSIGFIPWVVAAGVIGFLGNEAVAVFRIRVGREINSAALIADGYHARTDGFTSLAVVLGAVGVWLGFPLADPIVGLLITIAIFGIVWQSSKAVFVRMLDGVDPAVTDEIRHAAGHVDGVRQVLDVKARWLGHRLLADIGVRVPGNMPMADADRLAENLRHEMLEHVPALSVASVRVSSMADDAQIPREHDAPLPFEVRSELADGELSIAGTPAGERMRLTLSRRTDGLKAVVVINRAAGPETLVLAPSSGDLSTLESGAAPAEPHEFNARLILSANGKEDIQEFHMAEPVGHAH
ncbi:cation transporter [Bradyrhizobium diazoefficiens]|nr:cation diffusion facilitator family transporter [Bradyrhizobium diazoefficiens]MBR0967216.1 cation transporter [Bradyrhizobium diazoefficiens]MBR0977368.1 cation transporter [Bradyrhizobium diazoefficiens]MBR1007917.1 cation transporter [Bradyrhizobium diazoefficiens]MBR1013433.1 cation transporter [Bradyrhizobium diazoefficiens]MBR1051690.1 cation transporter [Bradyrhizobium diazoefficiens]